MLVERFGLCLPLGVSCLLLMVTCAQADLQKIPLVMCAVSVRSPDSRAVRRGPTQPCSLYEHPTPRMRSKASSPKPLSLRVRVVGVC